jgi:hypothetical protein
VCLICSIQQPLRIKGESPRRSFPGHRKEVTQRELGPPSSRKSLFTGKFEFFDLTGSCRQTAAVPL